MNQTNIEINEPIYKDRELKWSELKAGDHFICGGRLGMKLSNDKVWYWDGLYVCVVVPDCPVYIVRNLTLTYEMP